MGTIGTLSLTALRRRKMAENEHGSLSVSSGGDAQGMNAAVRGRRAWRWRVARAAYAIYEVARGAVNYGGYLKMGVSDVSILTEGGR